MQWLVFFQERNSGELPTGSQATTEKSKILACFDDSRLVFHPVDGCMCVHHFPGMQKASNILLTLGLTIHVTQTHSVVPSQAQLQTMYPLSRKQ